MPPVPGRQRRTRVLPEEFQLRSLSRLRPNPCCPDLSASGLVIGITSLGAIPPRFHAQTDRHRRAAAHRSGAL